MIFFFILPKFCKIFRERKNLQNFKILVYNLKIINYNKRNEKLKVDENSHHPLYFYSKEK